MVCCPYYRMGGCAVAAALRLCSGASEATGSCVTLQERCCGVTNTGVHLWETCRFYVHAADCRYCRHYDAHRGVCRKRNTPVRYYTGVCHLYEGPRPVPTLVSNA